MYYFCVSRNLQVTFIMERGISSGERWRVFGKGERGEDRVFHRGGFYFLSPWLVRLLHGGVVNRGHKVII